jgi:hypothetical protein
MNNKKSQIITRCLEDIRSEKFSLEECLARYPEFRHELQPLLEIALQIGSEKISISSEFKQRARWNLYQEMDKTPSRFLDRWGGMLAHVNPFHSLRMLAVILPVCVVLVFSGVLYASRGSLPDESLFGLKTGLENINLAVTRDPYKKADMRLVLIERRVDEIVAMNQLGRPVTAEALECLSSCLDQALFQISTVDGLVDPIMLEKFTRISLAQKKRLGEIVEVENLDQSQVLYQAYQVTRRGADMAVMAENNPDFLQVGSLTQSALDTNRFTLRGELLQINDEDWNIGGVVLKKVRIRASDIPAARTVLEIKGLFLEKGTFITDITLIEMPGDRVMLDGTFISSGQDGRTWDVSGFDINPPPGMNSPLPGQEFEIQGVVNQELDSVEWEDNDGDQDDVNQSITVGARNTEGRVSPDSENNKSVQDTAISNPDTTENQDSDTARNGSQDSSLESPVELEQQDHSSGQTENAEETNNPRTVENGPENKSDHSIPTGVEEGSAPPPQNSTQNNSEKPQIDETSNKLDTDIKSQDSRTDSATSQNSQKQESQNSHSEDSKDHSVEQSHPSD